MKHPLDYHQPSAKQVEQINSFRSACKVLHAHILSDLPAGRERAVAITNLEQVSMWGNKAIIMADEGEAV